MTRACGTLAAGMPIFAAIPSASASLSPVPGSMNALWIFSGVLAATSSMSMPPSLEAMSATRCVPRSTTMPTYSSFLMSAPSSMRSRRTFCPSGPVWCVLSIMPRILPAHSRTSSADFATFTPPPLPRPPAWICAFTTHTLPPSSRVAATASSTEKQGTPCGVATPYLRRISLAWYSWIFMLVLLSSIRRMDCSAAPPRRALMAVKCGSHAFEQVGVAAADFQLLGPSLDRHELAFALVADDAGDGARVDQRRTVDLPELRRIELGEELFDGLPDQRFLLRGLHARVLLVGDEEQHVVDRDHLDLVADGGLDPLQPRRRFQFLCQPDERLLQRVR